LLVSLQCLQLLDLSLQKFVRLATSGNFNCDRDVSLGLALTDLVKRADEMLGLFLFMEHLRNIILATCTIFFGNSVFNSFVGGEFRPTAF
jgi:hypothetical protein